MTGSNYKFHRPYEHNAKSQNPCYQAHGHGKASKTMILAALSWILAREASTPRGALKDVDLGSITTPLRDA